MFALSGLTSLALAASCGGREFGSDDDGKGNGGAGGEGSSSGGTGNESKELRISGELPDAPFNIAYEARLEIENAGDGLVVEISDGDLPRGLKLSKTGVLSDKPVEEGTFDFTVVASDNTERTASVELTLEVTRKRWLAYVASTGADGPALLYVVDTSKAQLPKTLISEGTATGEYVAYSDYRFSADGSRLAFAVTNGGGDKSLFVADLSGDTPGEAVRIDTEAVAVGIGGFALTPNGKGLAFHAEVDTDAWQLFYVSLDDDGSSDPELVDDASGGYAVTWVTNSRVVYGAETQHVTRVLENGSFGEAQVVRQYGTYSQIHRPSQRLLLTNAVTGCAMTGWLYDFADGGRESIAPAEEDYRWPTYDSKLTRVAHADGDGGMFVFDAMKTTGEPLGLVSPSFACEQVFWSPNAERVVMTNDATPARLMLSTIGDDSFVTKEIPGDYTTPNNKHVGYADANRLIFAAGNVIYESKFDGSMPSEATAIHEPTDAASETIDRFSVAPDGSWAFFFGTQSIPSAGSIRPYAIDLRGDSPGTLRILANGNVSGLDGNSARTFDTPSISLDWSADSSRLAYVTHIGTTSP